MDSDQLSVASDFSIIPESMIHMNDGEQMLTPMTASFFHSSSDATSLQSALLCDQASVMFGPVIKIGSEPTTSFSVMFWFCEQFEPKSSDRIAMYKVGFSSTKDFICYKWIPAAALAKGKVRSFTVDFESDIVPKDSDESFQICYLMKDGHIQGMSTTFKLNDTEASSLPTSAVEEAARNVLSVRVRELTQENSDLKKEVDDAKTEASLLGNRNAKLEEEIKEISSVRNDEAELIKRLRQNIQEYDSEIQMLKAEILAVGKNHEEKSLMNEDLEKKMVETVLSLNEFRDKLTECEGEKSICEERNQVLADDNKELRETIKALKIELETFMKEKVAAEKIASDLSQELQTTRDNYHELTQINSKLLKKNRKFKKIIAMVETTNNDDIGSVEEYIEKKGTDFDQEKNDDDLMSASFSASQASAAISHCPSSSCSQKLNDTVVSVKETMDRIVLRLSEQTEEMKSLKREISRRSLDKSLSSSHVKEKSKQKDEKPAGSSDDKVLYEKSFLPANCTAPVFFPAKNELIKNCHVSTAQGSLSQNTIPSAPSPTPSMMQEEASALPPPLRPIATKTARQAEVLKYFSDNADSTTTDDIARQNIPSVERSRQPHQNESDDDDYHSTGDVEQPSAEQSSILKCPLCPLEFLPSGIHLLNTHINCHLDKICPVCSLVIEINTSQKEYEKHVHSHFSDDTEDGDNDPSGPWDPRDPSRSFHLLEID